MAAMLLVAGTPELDRHDVGARHPERAARITAALSGIDAAGLRDAVIPLDVRQATMEELALVHPMPFLEALQAFCDAGGGRLDPDTPASTGSWDTALLASGAVLQAVDQLSAGSGTAAFVAARPPGHHALADHAMGFCLVNNIAVAAAALVARGERVLIVDWDVHHGNGTQAIFWDEPEVLYVSTHQSPWYPGTGQVEETGGSAAPGTTINVPLPAGATGDVLLQAFDAVVDSAVADFGPTWVLVSAGFDAHRADPLAELSLTAGDFAALAARVADLAPAPGRLVVVLEGGYDLDALRLSVGATLSALLHGDYRPEAPSAGGPGATAVDAVRRYRAETLGW